MTRPIIAIVGRTNVGKSTLLNRLAGKRLAVVDDVAGITRDRVFASASWQGQELTLVDTAGWQVEAGSRLEQKVKQQVEIAVAQADVIIFVVDAREGVIAVDEEIADTLRVGGKPMVMAVNKVDSLKQRNEVADFCSLGMGVPIGISAYHGRGIDELMDAVLQVLPSTGSVEESEQTRFAVVGRPNVGKSTLLNSLLGYQRAIADEAPGTTRDALDAGLRWDGKDILLIDTAGVKRPGRVDSGVDYYSMLRALQAINRCDVALLLIDAAEFVTAQDMHIAGYIIEAGKGMVLLVNKWDLIPNVQQHEFQRCLGQRLRFMSYVPALYISATLGHNIRGVLPQAWHVWQERQKRVSASAVDMVIKQAMEKQLPPRVGSRQLRVLRACQDKSVSSAFVLHVNDPHLVSLSYQRYLVNSLRREFGFCGSPLRLVLAKASGKRRRVGEEATRA